MKHGSHRTRNLYRTLATTMLVGGVLLTTGANTPTSAATPHITISYWFYPEFDDVPGYLAQTKVYGGWENLEIKWFEKSHPNITVDPRLLPYSDAGYQSVLNAITAGDPPDVIREAQLRLSLYHNLGVLYNLSSAISPADRSDFGSNLSVFTYNGGLFAYPLYAYHDVLLVNKSIFDQAGDSKLLPTNPGGNWTYSQFLTAVQAVNDPPKHWGVAVPSGDETGDYYTAEYLYGYGATLFNAADDRVILDSPAGVKGMTFLRTLDADNLIPPGSVVETYYNAETLFIEGKVAIFPGSDLTWNEVSQGWASAKLPHFPITAVNYPSTSGTSHAVGAGPTGFGVFKKSNPAEQAAALEFADYLASAPQERTDCVAAGQFCFRNSLAGVLGNAPGVQLTETIMDHNPVGNLGWSSPYYDIARPFFYPAVQAAMLGTESPSDALQRFQVQANQAIQQQSKS